jgi:predicted nucleic acid-binding protein
VNAAASAEPNIFDIRSHEPKGGDAFLVDTNAWYWTTYTRATTDCLRLPRTRQLEQYLRFLKKALDVGSTIVRCDLTLAELAHRIENTEKTIYEHYSLKGQVIRLKEYRAIAAERARVISAVESSWGQVKKMSECSVLTVGGESTNAAFESFKSYPIGGYDLFHIEAMRQKGLTAVLTDDGDFSQMTTISIYTCNEAVLRKAGENGRLVK